MIADADGLRMVMVMVLVMILMIMRCCCLHWSPQPCNEDEAVPSNPTTLLSMMLLMRMIRGMTLRIASAEE